MGVSTDETFQYIYEGGKAGGQVLNSQRGQNKVPFWRRAEGCSPGVGPEV